jgi:putative transposase
VIVGYIDEHRDEFGIEPICRVLTEAGAKIAPSTYHASKSRPMSARAARDTVLLPLLMALWVTNKKVYGAHKLWKAARRDGQTRSPASCGSWGSAGSPGEGTGCSPPAKTAPT